MVSSSADARITSQGSESEKWGRDVRLKVYCSIQLEVSVAAPVMIVLTAIHNCGLWGKIA